MTKPIILTLENLEDALSNDTKIKVAAVDIDGILRGKIMHKDKFLHVAESGFGKLFDKYIYLYSMLYSKCCGKIIGFCSVIFGWDIQDNNYTTPSEFAGKDCQYFDLIAKIDLSSYRRIPWENDIPFFFVSLYHPVTNKPLYCCPRNLLKSAVDQFNEIGLSPYCGVEFEFFCFKGTVILCNLCMHLFT